MKISIVIPVYNVQSYLNACVKSIIGNDMSNVEILLIDDGSTDESGKICDNLSRQYNFIRVFHKQNEGLSIARNFGITRAKGKWISFVDSDDIVCRGYVSILKDFAKENKYDIFIFKHQNFKSIDEIKNGINKFNNKKLFSVDKIKAMESLNINIYGNYAWNKFYRKDLFNKIKYPKFKTYEDIYTTYLLYAEAKKIALYDDILYFYRQHRGSIVYQNDITKKIKTFKDRYKAVKIQQKYMIKHYPSVGKKEKKLLVAYSISLISYIEVYNLKKDNVYFECKNIINNYKSNIKQDGLKNAILVITYNHFHFLYYLIIKLILLLKNRSKI